MPMYEFYCPDCHMIFTFFSRRVNTDARPACPKCGRLRMDRQVSQFAVTGRAGEKDGNGPDLPVSEERMERAIQYLAREAENIKEDDPREAARLMRKFSSMTGMELGKGMSEALARMEGGEDPEKIEEEMGDLLEAEEPFAMEGGASRKRTRRGPPARDASLYEL